MNFNLNELQKINEIIDGNQESFSKLFEEKSLFHRFKLIFKEMQEDQEKLVLKEINIDKTSKIAVYGEIKDCMGIQEEIFNGKKNYSFAEVINEEKGEDLSSQEGIVYEETYTLKDLEKGTVFEIKNPLEAFMEGDKDFIYVSLLNGSAQSKFRKYDDKIAEMQNDKLNFVQNYNKLVKALEEHCLLEYTNEEVNYQDFVDYQDHENEDEFER